MAGANALADLHPRKHKRNSRTGNVFLPCRVRSKAEGMKGVDMPDGGSGYETGAITISLKNYT